MTNEELAALVGRLELQARDNPASYQGKVLMLAMLGNAYMTGILLALLAVLAFLAASVATLKAVALKLILLVGFFLWMVARALWVKIPAPQGTQVLATQAPQLFAMVNDMRGQLGAPYFHHVLITDEFNAGVVQSPRLGIFGWPKNYLLLGLPLMKALSTAQFKAVLAHELGHLAGGHGKASNWIYRQRLRWSRLVATLEANESWGTFLFKPFLNWFAPYFNAFSFPLARANEYEADATSARLTSSQTAASALTSVDVVSSYLAERYWPQIHKLADEQAHPGFAPYRDMGQDLAAGVDADAVQHWLERALARKTDLADTHPSLADRLQSIGEPPLYQPPSVGDTADQLLGDALNAITESFDQRWKNAILPSWEERHQQVQGARRRLAELEARSQIGPALSVAEAIGQARLTETVGSRPDDALALYRALYQQWPENVSVIFGLGARLLQRDDDAGYAMVERAMLLDEAPIAYACELLRDYCQRQGRESDASAWHQRMLARNQLQSDAADERNKVSLTDKFQSHDVGEPMLSELCAQLRLIPGIRKAYLVRKAVTHVPEQPCFVFAYRVTGFFQLHKPQRVQDILAQLHAIVRFPGETLLINIDSHNSAFTRKFARVPGARLI